MTIAGTEHYSVLSAGYLRQAPLHLSEGDLIQASEQAWPLTPLL